MPFVIDASVVLAWAFDEAAPVAAAARARLRSEPASAPGLWWYELRNVLVIGERRGRISERRTEEFLRDLATADLAIDHAPNETAVMALARKHRLTVYDASYLELALRAGVPLATLDAPLASAAVAEGVALIGA
jgi:predicted nucleic acid-binding protein